VWEGEAEEGSAGRRRDISKGAWGVEAFVGSDGQGHEPERIQSNESERATRAGTNPRLRTKWCVVNSRLTSVLEFDFCNVPGAARLLVFVFASGS